MALNPVLVSDMGGVIYSFSPTFDPNVHNEIFERVVKELEIKKEITNELEAEFLAVSSWFGGKRGAEVLPIYPVTGAAARLAANSSKYKIVIVSTSLRKTSEMILRYAFEMAEIDGSFINQFDIVNMAEFGSKKSPEAWATALSPYDNIRVIVEDNETNLQAAVTALEMRGNVVEKSMVMRTF